MKIIMNERDGSSCFSHNKRRVLKINLDFNLLKMKFAMQQLKPVRSWTTVSFTNSGLFPEQYFHVSYLRIPAGVEFFHCSNVLLHSLVRAGISQGFPSLPRSNSRTSVSPLGTAQGVFIETSVEHTEQIHQNPFRACKAIFHSAWNGQLFSEAMNGHCQCSSVVKGSFRGSWSRLEHSSCPQSSSFFHIFVVCRPFLDEDGKYRSLVFHICIRHSSKCFPVKQKDFKATSVADSLSWRPLGP